ncbi:hypothetical protein [Ochrovirga pacifica]|uniref:hypothetical protein n=1 Tax=Ochrovirga pacifica TaxID=1042376 RepID=UPI0002559DD5|nr:hypothetical protein [Ochrovirga pacifica]
MLLKKTKFFGICYADEMEEMQFFAREFCANVQGNQLVFSFVLMKGLDKELVEKNLATCTFFEIEDLFIQKKITALLKEAYQIKKISLVVNHQTFYLKQLKLKLKGFVMRTI